jgi:hypothetical protein
MPPEPSKGQIWLRRGGRERVEIMHAWGSTMGGTAVRCRPLHGGREWWAYVPDFIERFDLEPIDARANEQEREEPMTAIEKLTNLATERFQAKHEVVTVTITLDPDSFMPWSIESEALLTEGALGNTIEEAAERALGHVR